MGLETVTTVSDLNTSWPLATDSRRQGDDHIRGLKVAVKSLLTNPQQIGLPTFTGNAGKIVKVNAGATALDVIAQGAGGGLDADTVDGNQASAFATAAALATDVANLATHIADVANPHTVTKTQIGLSAVTNDAQITKALGTTKGDLVGFSASATPVRVGVGANGLLLTADSSAAAGFAWAAAAAAGAGFKSVQVLTASGTWTRPSGITAILVMVIGGGGAGASGTTDNSGGGGGGGGVAFFLKITPDASYSYTVGGAGAASSWNSTDAIANQGVAGATTGVGGVGGTASAGTFGFRGTPGGSGNGHTAAGTKLFVGGAGGGLGGGIGGAAGAGAGGAALANTGAGGGGGGSTSGAGGAGASGIVVVFEFGS